MAPLTKLAGQRESVCFDVRRLAPCKPLEQAFPVRRNAQGAVTNHPFIPLFGDQGHSRGALGAQRTNYGFDGVQE